MAKRPIYWSGGIGLQIGLLLKTGGTSYPMDKPAEPKSLGLVLSHGGRPFKD